MEAGRELDARVAEKVMGWTREDAYKRYILRSPETDMAATVWDGSGFNDLSAISRIPHFSTEIGAAWSVVQKIAMTYGLIFHLELYQTGTWQCWLGDCRERADTAPLAICLAALKVVE